MFIASVAFSETGINCTESLSSEVLPFRTIFKLLSHFSFSMLCKFYNACAECISCSVCAVRALKRGSIFCTGIHDSNSCPVLEEHGNTHIHVHHAIQLSYYIKSAVMLVV